VGDLASIAVTSAGDPESRVLDAIGPETFSFEELVALIAAKIGRNVRLVHLSPFLGIFLGRMIGWFVRDVVLTKDELKGLMDSLLCSEEAPNGKTRFSQWLETNANSLGTSYSSELVRHFRWKKAGE
jgi:NADH dehydrogenase